MDADIEAAQRAELLSAGDPDSNGALCFGRDFHLDSPDRTRKSRPVPCPCCRRSIGVCRNVRRSRRLQLSVAYRFRLADKRLSALLFAAGGPLSTRGTGVAGIN